MTLPNKHLLALLAATTLVAGCRQDMHDAPRYEPYEKSDFFPDKRSSRPLVAGTIARGHLREDTPAATGKVAGGFVATSPVPVTLALVQRGRQRYDIYCSPCHGVAGDGDGMIVKRGYKQPTSYHDPRLRNERAGYFFDVMTRGFGQMPDYAAQVSPKDRWAIVAYIRALQLSQHASVGDLTKVERERLDRGETGPEPAQGETSGHAPAAEGAPKHD
jgi:mono/diheme cytochrome c family protein